MKKLTFLLLTTLLTACSGGTSVFTPASSGTPYELLVVCDDNIWNAPAGRTLFDILDTDIPGLPQPERTFRFSQATPAGFSKLLKSYRNIIEVKIDPAQYTQTKLKYTRDKFAAPQMLMTIQSPDEKDLQEFLTKNSQTIIDFFTSNEMNLELKELQKHHNKEFMDSVRKKFDCELLIPMNITGIKSGKDFLWASDIKTATRSFLNFVVYSYPYTDVSNFSMENFLQKRDSILKVNIPGSRPDRFMTTEHDFVILKDTEFRERYMQVVRGLWSMENDIMGGPFVSHGLVDEKNDKVIVVEAFVYNPSGKKGNMMRKLEAALFSLKLPADKEIQNSLHMPEIIIENTDSTKTIE